MAKPWTHAQSSARKFGGKPEDYMPIHQLMDSSKGTHVSPKHRVFTHNSWFIAPGGPLELIFGITIANSEGRPVSVRSIGEQHIAEDYGGFIPDASDFLNAMNLEPWMNGAGAPPSGSRIFIKREVKE